MSISQEELARLSGYSRLTVSRVLAGQAGVSQETRQKILLLAQEHRYRPNAAARAIRNQKTHQIGLVLCNTSDVPFHNPVAFEMMMGLNNRLARDGYILMLIRIGDVLEGIHEDSRVFQEHSLDGMILSGQIPTRLTDHIETLVSHCLFVDTNVWQPTRCIQRDEAAAGRTAAMALVNAGYRRLAWLGQLPRMGFHYSLDERHRAVQAVAKRHGIELEYIPDGEPANPGLNRDFVARVKKLASPDLGVVAYNTNVALNWMDAALQHGLLPKQGYGLVCCDNSYTNFQHMPSLSSVPFDRFQMGIQAAEMMLNWLESSSAPASKRIGVTWHEGATCGLRHG